MEWPAAARHRRGRRRRPGGFFPSDLAGLVLWHAFRRGWLRA